MVLSFPFWSTVLQCGARLPIHLKLLFRAVSDARFLTGGVFECDIAHRRHVAVLCMVYKIRCNPMHPLKMHYLGRMCQCGLHTVHWSYIGILMRHLAAELAVSHDFFSPLSVPLERSCCPLIRWCGTGGFLEQGHCILIGLTVVQYGVNAVNNCCMK